MCQFCVILNRCCRLESFGIRLPSIAAAISSERSVGRSKAIVPPPWLCERARCAAASRDARASAVSFRSAVLGGAAGIGSPPTSRRRAAGSASAGWALRAILSRSARPAAGEWPAARRSSASAGGAPPVILSCNAPSAAGAVAIASGGAPAAVEDVEFATASSFARKKRPLPPTYPARSTTGVCAWAARARIRGSFQPNFDRQYGHSF